MENVTNHLFYYITTLSVLQPNGGQLQVTMYRTVRYLACWTKLLHSPLDQKCGLTGCKFVQNRSCKLPDVMLLINYTAAKTVSNAHSVQRYVFTLSTWLVSLLHGYMFAFSIEKNSYRYTCIQCRQYKDFCF